MPASKRTGTHVVKIVHIVALAVFIGSIAVYIVAARAVGADLQALAVARRIIRTGTLVTTVPAFWLAVATGLWSGRNAGLGHGPRWLKAKLAIALLIAANMHALIVPATGSALAAVQTSCAGGTLDAAYRRADTIETVAGGVNVILIIALVSVAVAKPALAPGRRPLSP